MINLIKTGFFMMLKDPVMLCVDLILATSIQFYLLFYVFSLPNFDFLQGRFNGSLSWYLIFTILIVRMNNTYDFIVKYPRDLRSGVFDALTVRGFSYFKMNLFEFLGGSLIYVIPIFIVTCVAFVYKNIAWHLMPLFFANLFLAQILAFSVAVIFSKISMFFDREDFGATLFIVSLSLFGGEVIPAEVLPEELQIYYRYNPFFVIGGGISELFYYPSAWIWFRHSLVLIGFAILSFFLNRHLDHFVKKFFRSQGG